MTVAKIENFTDLVTWQTGHDLVLAVYGLTKQFPSDEHFGLTSQVRRAAVSITSNIAEGFSRATSADMAHFYTMALGSLMELQNQLLVARDVGYISAEQFDFVAKQSASVQKMLHGLVRTVRQGKGLRGESTKHPILNTAY